MEPARPTNEELTRHVGHRPWFDTHGTVPYGGRREGCPDRPTEVCAW